MTATTILDHLPLLGRWRRARAARRAEVERRATALLAHEGSAAYYRARDRAREVRARGEHAEYMMWTRVAQEIARRTGKVIGGKAMDPWEEPRR